MGSIFSRLREERERLGYTQADFADLAGQTRKSQIRYESGERSPDGEYYAAIAGHGADISYILTGVRSSLPPSPDVDPAVGRRLARWRREHGVILGDMAHKVGANVDYIEMIEGGAKPAKPVFLDALREAYGIDPDWLLHGDRPEVITDVVGQEHPGAFVQVPMLNAHLSAGPGALNTQEGIVGNLAFRADWLRREGIQPGKASLVRVRGDSMEPTLRDGALVLVDHAATDPARHDIFALRIGEDVQVKRLHRQGEVLLVSSDNPAYDSRIVTGSDLGEVHVIGRVVWQGYTFRKEAKQ